MDDISQEPLLESDAKSAIPRANIQNQKNTTKGNQLVSVEEVPPPFQQVFAEFPTFNQVQSAIYDDVIHTDKSLVVSAPTGSGKTVIFELAIIRLLLQSQSDSFPFKIIYICPLKALCEERFIEWRRKLRNFGLEAVSITGDSINADISYLDCYNLIISTPEKWDSLTRKWRDNKNFVHSIKLFMIDEVHLLNEETRGATLESVVCRMKTIEKTMSNEVEDLKIRFVAVSANISNIEDVAEWIGQPPNIKYYQFGEEYRPVNLEKIIMGFPQRPDATNFKFELSLNYKLPNLILLYSQMRPTLIFCTTRKMTEMTADFLYKNLTINVSQDVKDFIVSSTDLMANNILKNSLVHGIGFHHAGLLPETRRTVEQLFRESKLPILVTTSTLAMGLNLPAHLVIVKSTKFYSNGEYKDYTKTHLLQMIGRAGRPQFDTTATALIMTNLKDKVKYENMLEGHESLESNLHRHLTEHLNAEVALKTITHLDVALQWLTSSFLYVRARKNPNLYGLISSTKEQIDHKLTELSQIEVNKLAKEELLILDEDLNIKPTELGILMAKYCIAFETIKLFKQMTGYEVLQQLLYLLSQCHEFSEIYLRVSDKKCLNLLNKCKNGETIRFPLNGKIQTPEMKINCIIQAVLGCLNISEVSLVSESQRVMRSAERVAKGLIEYLKLRKQSFRALLNALVLSKCLAAKLWENSPYVSKQLSGIGHALSVYLIKAGLDTFEAIAQLDPRDIELVLNRKSPFGDNLLEQVRLLPKYKLGLFPTDKLNYHLILSVENAEEIRANRCTVESNSMMHVIVGDSYNNVIFYKTFKTGYLIDQGVFEKDVKVLDQNCGVEAHLISADWVGVDAMISANIREEKPEEPVVVQNPETKSAVPKPKTKSIRTKSIIKPQTHTIPVNSPPALQTLPKPDFVDLFLKIQGHQKSQSHSESNTKISETPRMGSAEKVGSCRSEQSDQVNKTNSGETKVHSTEFEVNNNKVSSWKEVDNDLEIIESESNLKSAPAKSSKYHQTDIRRFTLQHKKFTSGLTKPKDAEASIDKSNSKISWRSPVTMSSPTMKFSPKLPSTTKKPVDTLVECNQDFQEGATNPTPLKTLDDSFPLCDAEYNEALGEKTSVCHQLMEIVVDFVSPEQWTESAQNSQNQNTSLNAFESPSFYYGKILSQNGQEDNSHKKNCTQNKRSIISDQSQNKKLKMDNTVTSNKDMEKNLQVADKNTSFSKAKDFVERTENSQTSTIDFSAKPSAAAKKDSLDLGLMKKQESVTNNRCQEQSSNQDNIAAAHSILRIPNSLDIHQNSASSQFGEQSKPVLNFKPGNRTLQNSRSNVYEPDSQNVPNFWQGSLSNRQNADTTFCRYEAESVMKASTDCTQILQSQLVESSFVHNQDMRRARQPESIASVHLEDSNPGASSYSYPLAQGGNDTITYHGLDSQIIPSSKSDAPYLRNDKNIYVEQDHYPQERNQCFSEYFQHGNPYLLQATSIYEHPFQSQTPFANPVLSSNLQRPVFFKTEHEPHLPAQRLRSLQMTRTDFYSARDDFKRPISRPHANSSYKIGFPKSTPPNAYTYQVPNQAILDTRSLRLGQSHPPIIANRTSNVFIPDHSSQTSVPYGYDQCNQYRRPKAFDILENRSLTNYSQYSQNIPNENPMFINRMPEQQQSRMIERNSSSVRNLEPQASFSQVKNIEEPKISCETPMSDLLNPNERPVQSSEVNNSSGFYSTNSLQSFPNNMGQRPNHEFVRPSLDIRNNSQTSLHSTSGYRSRSVVTPPRSVRSIQPQSDDKYWEPFNQVAPLNIHNSNTLEPTLIEHNYPRHIANMQDMSLQPAGRNSAMETPMYSHGMRPFAYQNVQYPIAGIEPYNSQFPHETNDAASFYDQEPTDESIRGRYSPDASAYLNHPNYSRLPNEESEMTYNYEQDLENNNLRNYCGRDNGDNFLLQRFLEDN